MCSNHRERSCGWPASLATPLSSRHTERSCQRQTSIAKLLCSRHREKSCLNNKMENDWRKHSMSISDLHMHVCTQLHNHTHLHIQTCNTEIHRILRDRKRRKGKEIYTIRLRKYSYLVGITITDFIFIFYIFKYIFWVLNMSQSLAGLELLGSCDPFSVLKCWHRHTTTCSSYPHHL